jgi:hypothetical protein
MDVPGVVGGPETATGQREPSDGTFWVWPCYPWLRVREPLRTLQSQMADGEAVRAPSQDGEVAMQGVRVASRVATSAGLLAPVLAVGCRLGEQEGRVAPGPVVPSGETPVAARLAVQREEGPEVARLAVLREEAPVAARLVVLREEAPVAARLVVLREEMLVVAARGAYSVARRLVLALYRAARR